MKGLQKLWQGPPKGGRFLPVFHPSRPLIHSPRPCWRLPLPVVLVSIAFILFFSFELLGIGRSSHGFGHARGVTLEGETSSDGTLTSSVSFARRPPFNETFMRVVNSVPGSGDDASALLQPVQGTGVAKLREFGLRARKYKEYLQAWEELHLFLDENGVGYVRDDVLQQLRRHFDESPPDELTGGGLAHRIRSYETRRHFMASFGQLLFPWTAPYFSSHLALHSHFKQSRRGIVFTAGQAGVPFLTPSIRSLRKLGCTLPIEIMYMGDSDIDEGNRAKREQLDGVTTRDFSGMVDDKDWKLSGWAAKPFAILFSSFREAIFIDADSLFLKNPQVLFDEPEYRKTGALFFRDRNMWPRSRKEWLEQILPEPISEQVKQSHFWTGRSEHVQESGVVVVDKWRHLVALLMVTRMNGPDRSGEGQSGIYDMVYGDKETFWLGWELVGDTDYAFHPGGLGNMGVAQTNGEEAQSNRTWTICAPQLLHLGSDGRPLWFNGWLAENKFVEAEQRRLAKFEHFLVEPREFGEQKPWLLRTNNVCCLTAESKGVFTAEEEETLKMLIGAAAEENIIKME